METWHSIRCLVYRHMTTQGAEQLEMDGNEEAILLPFRCE